MTRKKKSRKPSAAPLTSSKSDKKNAVVISDKKPKKKTGKNPGNRQQEATNKKVQGHQSKANKDPRLGSKKPIDLGVAIKTEKAPTKKASKKPAAIAAVTIVNESQGLEQELQAIEQDAQLLEIIEKQETEQALSETEIAYFNEKMDRHQEISEQLGISEEEQDEQSSESLDEDALWDKLDSSDFSSFE